MAKRMYYTEAETAAKLGVGLAALTNMVRDNKLHAYTDGPRKMFKCDDVDALSGGAGGEVELTPAEGAEVSLTEADSAKPPTKEDTVITAEGISIFDDEDLEIETADPMAKTQIAPSVEEQTSLEGVGSGSGLLDLTRESDDTSLGAEVLDHIDMEGAVGSGIAHEIPETGPAYVAQQEIVVVESSAADSMDASSGLFGGVTVAAAMLMVLMGVVVGAAMQGTTPAFVLGMKENIGVVLGVAVLVMIIGAVAGFMMGKAVAARQEAIRKVGG